MENNHHSKETLWDPMEVFIPSSNFKYALLILNQPIRLKKEILIPLWKRAQITITVDGGTNRWLTYLESTSHKVLNGECPELTPDMVTGDFDSISHDTLAKIQKLKGVTIIETPDQEETDYTKALKELSVICKEHKINLDGIYVVVETSGRFDHIIANINTLYKSQKFMKNVDHIVHLASNSLTWLLASGKHCIKIPEKLRHSQSCVGIIPFGSSVHNVNSTGLKYNLENSTLAFGGLVSTSNTYNGSSEVTINTKENIIWTMDIESLTMT